MNDLFEEEVTPQTKAHTLWVEKYRPTKLEDYIGNESIKTTVDRIIKTGVIPNMLFYGGAGTGKTTLAKLITKNIDCDTMYINASDEGRVDDIRVKIKSFASSVGFKTYKVVILDECDFMSASAQAALRNMIETFSVSTRFILTCNFPEKVILPIISRCQTYQIVPISKKEVAIHLTKILGAENVTYTPDDIGYIVNKYYPDIRKVINFSQQSAIDGKLVISKENSVEVDCQDKLVEMLKNGIGKSGSFNEIRQFMADAQVVHYDEYFAVLYKKIDEYASGKQALATIIISEYMYQCSTLTASLKEIAFMACVSRLLTDLKK